MTLFNNKININEGKKYDTSQVSMDGISKEELAEIEKKNKKLIDIYKALGAGDGMSSIDLAKAMDGFAKVADANSDGKLSKKELETYAQIFNKQNGLEGDNEVSGKDMKAFMKSVRKATKDDTKVSTDGVLKKEAARVKLQNDVDVAVNQFLGDLDAKAKAREEADAAKAKAEADAKEAARVAEEARIADLKAPKSYTVQPNERIESILKRSLEAQGLEVNEKNMADAKAEFIKNNPGALHGPKGKEYLYAADVIRVSGNLEDKANGDEIRAKFKPVDPPKVEIPKVETPKVETTPPSMIAKPTDKTPGYTPPKFEPGKDYKAPSPEEIQKKENAEKKEQTRVKIAKQTAAMNKYPVMEKLPNGFTRRDAPGYNDFYFDATGQRISESDYNKVRGPKSRLINNMVNSPILEELPNGYTRRDNPGPTNRCYDKDGRQISEKDFQAAKKAGAASASTPAAPTTEAKKEKPAEATDPNVVNNYKDGKLVSRTKVVYDNTYYYPITNNSTDGKQNIYWNDFVNEFNDTNFSVAYINKIANKYGEAAAKDLIDDYDNQYAKPNGKKQVKDQLILNGTTFIDAGRLKRLGLSKLNN